MSPSSLRAAASNLRGAPFELYTAGAKLLANHPVGPLGGTAVNATVMSYAGSLDIGLHVDRAAVDDPAELGRLVTSAFEDLFRVAGV